MRFKTYSSPYTIRGIDIHHHLLPPFFVDILEKYGHPASAKARALAWSPEKSLDMMDSVGIQTAIISLSLPDASFHGMAEPAALARQVNEYAARLISDHPGRFGAFASLPMLDVQRAMEEVIYALDILKLDGVMLLSNVRGRYLGDAVFAPLFTELNRRNAIVFMHPNQAPSPGFNEYVEFPHEITRALASLTESGGIERHRSIRYILAYGGGTVPFIASRVTVVGMVQAFNNIFKIMLSYIKRVRTLRRMNYDLTASTDAFTWQAIRGHARPAHILMGSNYPWTPPGMYARQRMELRTFEGLDMPQIESIERRNALKLFPRFA